jgi:hypothetical protein
MLYAGLQMGEDHLMAPEKTKSLGRSLEGLFVGGAIPAGHEGPYQPPLEEYVAAIETVFKIRIAQMQAAQAEAILLLRDQMRDQSYQKGAS